MRDYHLPDDVRAAEAPVLAALPQDALMRRAAYGLAQVCVTELSERYGAVVGRRVTLLVGSGDNGGDALYAGVFLRRRGVAVDAVLLDPARAHARALAALRAARGRIVDRPIRPDLVIDGIVGIRGRGSLRPDAADVVAAVRAPIVAADTPSGVDVVTGAVDGPAVTAAVTVAFGAEKPVHALAPAHCGRIERIDLGLALPPARLLRSYTDADVARVWPVPTAHDDKYSVGVLGLVSGSAQYPGAAVLSVSSAVRSTSGMVRYAGTARDAVLAAWPEVVATDDPARAGRVQAWAVGPGMGIDGAAKQRLAGVLAQDLPTVLDADALTLLAADRSLLDGRTAPTLVTPHAGEFARLAGAELPPDRLGAARALAADLGVTVLLKGNVTVIADPGGSAVADTAGSAWAATPGSGDVLTGIIGTLVASGLSPMQAAACGARVHSRAAASAAAGAPTHAAAISAAVPRVLAEILRD